MRESARVALEGIRKRAASFYIVTDYFQHLGKSAFVNSFKNCVQRVHDRQSGLDENKQLLIEGDQSLGVDFFT